jgi:peptide/nickel transport system permease protein
MGWSGLLRAVRSARRVGLGVLTLVLVSVITFLATNVVPNDPARIALGRGATDAQLASYVKQQGLDRPMIPRYASWVGDFVRGDWGVSTRSRREVRSEVMPRLRRSATLALVAMLIAVPLALLLGTWLGRRSGTLVDLGSSIVLLLLNSLPEFVIGLVLLTIFGVALGVLPVESSAAVFGTGWPVVKAYILPVLALVVVVTPYMTRMVRVQVRETLGQPYVRTALLRGVGPRRLTWRHIVPNASIPVVNVVALNLAELLGGLVVVEVVFGFPGLGQLLVDSVQGKDIPSVQAIALLAAAGFVVINAIADAIVLFLNPRLRTAA